MPDGWRTMRIDDLADEVRQKVNPRSGRPARYVGLEHFDSGQSTLTRFGSTVEVESLKTPFEPGDTLFGKLRPYLRKVAFAEWAGCCSTDVLVFRPKPGLVIARYLTAILSSEPILRIAVETSAGTRMPRTSYRDLADTLVAVPPLPEQRRIVDLVAVIDEAAEAAQGVAVHASVAYQALSAGLFESGVPVVSLADAVTVAKAGGTPNRKNTAYFGGRVPWLKSGEVTSDRIATTAETITEEGLAASSAWIVPKDSIVVAMYGATAGAVGYLAAPMATNQAILALQTDQSRIHTRFLFHWLRGRSAAMKARASGAAQPNLSKQSVLEEAVPLLPLDRQRGATRALDSLLDVREEAIQVRQSLLILRAAVVADLLSGTHPLPAAYDAVLKAV